jgi:hypothetical protein
MAEFSGVNTFLCIAVAFRSLETTDHVGGLD